MSHHRAMHLLCLSVAGLLLQGCVAAAIPVLAGGAMVRSQTDGSRPVDAGLTAEPVPMVAESQPVADAALVATPINQDSAFVSFANYAMQQALLASGEEARRSAMLHNPGLLDGKRLGCGIQPLGILIDLDPGDELLSLDKGAQPEPQKANLLESLRRQGVEIAWISGRSAGDAGDVRNWLQAAGLDQSGVDTLLMMRYPDDRKQSRRAEFAKEYCVIAIAGDRPTDFDELYDFLIDPAKAIALQSLYGDGWFMIPPLGLQE